jgi:hypothetical protein
MGKRRRESVIIVPYKDACILGSERLRQRRVLIGKEIGKKIRVEL